MPPKKRTKKVVKDPMKDMMGPGMMGRGMMGKGMKSPVSPGRLSIDLSVPPKNIPKKKKGLKKPKKV